MLTLKQPKTTADAVVLFTATSLGFPNSFLFTLSCISLLFSLSEMQNRLNYNLFFKLLLLFYLCICMCGCVGHVYASALRGQQHRATRSWT